MSRSAAQGKRTTVRYGNRQSRELGPWRGNNRPFLDEWANYNGRLADTRDRAGLAFDVTSLRMMARHFIPATIVETILTHVKEAGRPQATPHALGFRVRLRDTERTPTKAEQKLAAQIAEEVYWCGVVPEPNERWRRQRLPEYLTLACRDSLELDRAFTEFIPDGKGEPAQWRALDGATAFWARDESGERYPVQVLANQSNGVHAEWKSDDPDSYRAWIMHRRPRTSMERNGYGVSELEDGWQILAGLQRGLEINNRYLSHGLTSAGVMAFSDRTSRKQLKSLSTFLQATATGSENVRRLLLMTYPDGQEPKFLPFTQATMNDMEFGNWLNFLLKIFCALYKIDPMLIGFQFGNEGQTSALSQGSGKDRIEFGKQKAIWPLMRAVFDGINDYYVAFKYPDFKVELGGLDTETEEERNKRDKETLDWLGTNEMRARRDLAKLNLVDEEDPANVPAPLLSYWKDLRMAKMGQEQGEGEGEGEGEGQGQFGEGQQPPEQAPEDDFAARLFDQDDDEELVKSLVRAAKVGIRNGSIVPISIEG
jgi:hypothetical protein